MKASLQARLAAFAVRRRVRPRLGDLSDIARVRQVFNQSLPSPRGVRYRSDTVGGVPGEWVEAEAAPATAPATTTLLYLHGGGFVGCSPRTHRPITGALARQGLRVFVPDYRLAPEHPFPAAALFSPALDLTGGSASLTLNAGRDAMFHGPSLANLSGPYLRGADAAQPLASPLLGRLDGLPPLLVHVGESEALRDDALRLAQRAREAGVTVELQVFPVVPHVWQMLAWLPEARQSLAATATFLRSAQPRTGPETFDVVIVGAGLSGIGAAVHLQRDCPGKRFTLLEARQTLGGTWDLFRYPGVRSDSDMYTLGYEFKPWKDAKAIADGPSILQYVKDTAAEHGITHHIRCGHRVV